MIEEKADSDRDIGLHLQSEKQLKNSELNPICSEEDKTNADSLALVHELQVHQIELEMQNEELRRAKLETESVLAKYSDLYDFSPIGLFTLDINRQIIEANLAGATLLDMERGRLINKQFKQFVAPKDHRLFDEFYKSALESAVKQTCELNLIKFEGSTIRAIIEGTASEDRLRNEKQLRIAIIDITQRKRAEESEERLKALMNHNPSLVFLKD